MQFVSGIFSCIYGIWYVVYVYIYNIYPLYVLKKKAIMFMNEWNGF